MPFPIAGAIPLMAMTFSALEWLACLLLSYMLGILSILVLPALDAFCRQGHDDGY